MTDLEIQAYIAEHRDVFEEDLEHDILQTSPQITGVYFDVLCDTMTVITPNNVFLFRIKYHRKERKINYENDAK